MISPKIAKSSAVFIILSILSLGMLFTSFAFPLQNLEVWKEPEISKLSQRSDKIFIITDADSNLINDFHKNKAVKISQIYRDYKYQKFGLLTFSLICSSVAFLLSDKAIELQQVEARKTKLKKFLRQMEEKADERGYLLDRVKSKWRLLSEAQKKQFVQEIKLILDFIARDKKGIIDAPYKPDIRKVSDMIDKDKFIEVQYLIDAGNDIDTAICKILKVAVNTQEHSNFKEKFVKWLSK